MLIGAFRNILARLFNLQQDCSGNVAIWTALAMPVLIGFGAIAAEGGFWHYRTKMMQDAADSAALAAAVSNSDNYQKEAWEVAARYGFVHTQSHVTVSPENGVTCPTPPPNVKYSKCYRVTVESIVPLFISKVVGFQGNTTLNDGGKLVPGVKLMTTALAARGGSPRDYCIIALGQAGVQMDLSLSGSKNADLKGCGIMSNEGMNCNGASVGFAEYADSPLGDPAGCGAPGPHSTYTPPQDDPYAILSDNIVPDPHCPDNPSTINNINGSSALSGIKKYCGTLRLTGPVNILNPTVLEINGGNLDLNGFSLTGSALTIVFTGKNPNAGTHTIVGDKTGSALNITAPTSGTWKGVALYQDKKILTGVNFTAEGNKPTMNVTGIMYMPNAQVVLKGAINKDASPRPCFVMVVGSLDVRGGGFFADGERCNGYVDLLAAERARLVN